VEGAGEGARGCPINGALFRWTAGRIQQVNGDPAIRFRLLDVIV
jgi:hypothetical protein